MARRTSVEDLVGLAVDLLLLGGGQVALPFLLRGARLGVPRMRLVGHRVLALVGQPELGLRLRVALLGAELGHRSSPLVLLVARTYDRHGVRAVGQTAPRF